MSDEFKGHTPGKWCYVPSSGLRNAFICGPKEARVAVFSNDVADANARLIAAAPEMAEELTRLRAELSEAEQSNAQNAALYFRAKERADASIAATEHLRSEVEASRPIVEWVRSIGMHLAPDDAPCLCTRCAMVKAARAALKETKP